MADSVHSVPLPKIRRTPDGKRFLTSIAKWPYDIWMLEGFDQPKQTTWLDRLLRR